MTADEVQRIRDVYEARAVGARYDPRRADQVAIASHRATVWGLELLRHDHDLGRVVEVGCGSGAVLRWAVEAGATHCFGVDVQRDRLAGLIARNPAIGCCLADGRSVPVRTGVADTVICSTLFSSILDDDVAHAVAGEIRRVLRPGGMVLWFDFFRDNPRNPHVRGVKAVDVGRLFPQFTANLRRVVLAPPIASRLRNHPRLVSVVEQVRPFRTHLAGALAAPL